MRRRRDPVEEELDELGPDEEDIALLEHVYDDGRPPQGLHRGGFTEDAHGVRVRRADSEES